MPVNPSHGYEMSLNNDPEMNEPVPSRRGPLVALAVIVLLVLGSLVRGSCVVGGEQDTGLRDGRAAQLRADRVGLIEDDVHTNPRRNGSPNFVIARSHLATWQPRGAALSSVWVPGLPHRQMAARNDDREG